MKFQRMAIEKESPEEFGYGNIECNLSESSVRDAVLGDLEIRLQELGLAYIEHRGDRRLREVIAAQYPGVSADDVLVTPGAAAALFMLHVVILDRGDHVVVEHPNYGTNLETPRAIGCALEALPLAFEDGFQPDLDRLRGMVSSRTRLISVTNPHNPTGVASSRRRWCAPSLEIASGCGARLLVDETYRDVSAVAEPPLAAGPGSARRLPSPRCPRPTACPGSASAGSVSRDAALMERPAGGQGADRDLQLRGGRGHRPAVPAHSARAFLPRIREHVARNAGRAARMAGRPEPAGVGRPAGGGGGLPALPLPRCASITASFYDLLLKEYRTAVGPGHWFEMDDRYLRIGYGYPDEKAMRDGLYRIEEAAARARRD